jgi:putative acetyltransferase
MMERVMTGASVAETAVRIESPRQPDVGRLLAALDAYLQGLYPPESNHILSLEELCRAKVRFLVARREGEALACGALVIEEGYGEVKRMFVLPAARGQGLGRLMLACIEARAAGEGITRLRLETGVRQAEALALYRASGYVERQPFGSYVVDPLSLFMEKLL